MHIGTATLARKIVLQNRFRIHKTGAHVQASRVGRVNERVEFSQSEALEGYPADFTHPRSAEEMAVAQRGRDKEVKFRGSADPVDPHVMNQRNGFAIELEDKGALAVFEF